MYAGFVLGGEQMNIGFAAGGAMTTLVKSAFNVAIRDKTGQMPPISLDLSP